MKKIYCRTVVVALLIISFISHQGHAQTNVVPDSTELQVLKNIYDSLGGTGWINKANWPTPGNWPATATAAQMDTWYGVDISAGDITRLNMGSNNLTGKMPQSISQLKALTFLVLPSNKINTLPQSINQLTMLQEIWLGGNPITSLPNLTGVNSLQQVSFRSIPSLLAGAVPLWLTDQVNLKTLDLSGCKLNGGIPSAISNLAQLTNLDLSNNQLTGNIPASIGVLTKLTSLNLSTNQLSGAIPFEIGNLTALTSLYANTNQLSGAIPTSIGNLTSLTLLSLYSNNITGAIPIEIGSLNKLTTLHLYSNKITGSIPNEICMLLNLVDLQINNNSLTGSIPSEIGKLNKVRYFHLYNNQLSGTLPASIKDMVGVYALRLENNQFTGSLPDLSKLWQLGSFIVNNNKLSGVLLASNFNTAIVDFQVSNNGFYGAFPDISKWKKIKSIVIIGNKFSGAFPSVVGLTDMTYIRAWNNEFTSIHSSLLSLPLINANGINFYNNKIKEITNLATDHANNAIHPPAGLIFNIYNNQLDFSQLKILRSLGIAALNYSPQSVIQVDTVGYHCLLTIPSRLPGSNSTITWKKKNGSSYVTVNSSNETPTTFTFTKTHAVLADSGTYTWSMTDTQFAGMTLQSAPIKVRQGVLSPNLAALTSKPGMYCGYDTLVLNSSERGVNYELLRENVPVAGTTTAGTGLGMSWSGRGYSGLYSVKASYVNCSNSTVSPAINMTCQFGDVSVTEQVTISAAPLVNSSYALVVGGDILSAGLNIKVPSKWPDYVFEKSYPLAPLTEVEDFIKEKGHLPNIPSARELTDAGSYSVGAMDAALLEKVEELTLHLIDIQQNGKQKKSKSINDISSESLQGDNKLQRVNAIMNWQNQNKQNIEAVESIANGNVYRADPLPSYGSAVVSDNVLIAPYKSVPSNYKLVVGGNIIALGIDIKSAASWPDYVFEEQYALPSIEELELYIKENGHLPGVPAAGEIEKEGIYRASEMDAMLLEKIEWLTLYAIQLKKEVARAMSSSAERKETAVAQHNDKQIQRNTADLTSQSLVTPFAETTSMTFDNVSVSNSLCIACTTVPASYKLAVGGTILATNIDIKVPHKWPDYVFGKEYKLMDLKKVKHFIKKNGHLPNVLSYQTMRSKGDYSVSEMDVKLLEKIEELTLYVTELHKALRNNKITSD